MKRLILILLLITSIVWNSDAQKNKSTSPYFIIQVTDPQFGMYNENKSFEKETELFEKAVAKINQLKPDFVVITGDLVNDKSNRSQIDEFKRIKALINPEIPVYLSPGNHDMGMPASQEDITKYISDYGSDRFSFRHKKSLFIGINSVIIKGNTLPQEEEQFEWLKKELLKGKRAKHIIIFTHYPFFINSADEKETYSNIQIQKRQIYIDMFSDNNVGAVFAGHLHNNGTGKTGNTEMITTSSIGKPLGKVPSGLRLIKIYPDKIETIFVGLDELQLPITY